MEKELQHQRAVARQVVLEIADIREALLPDILADEIGGIFCAARIFGMARTTSTSS